MTKANENDHVTELPGEPQRDEALKYIAKTEDMIQRFRDRDYVFTRDATKILLKTRGEKEPTTLPDQLARCFALFEDAIAKFPSEDEFDVSIRYNLARACLMTIDRAQNCGIVEDGLGLTRKLRECQARATELEDDLHKLSDEFQTLQANFEAYKQRVREPHEDETRRTP